MISWIQIHLMRHGRWLFLSLLAIIIVAFVFTIGNTPGCSANESNYQAQYFYGIDLNSKRASQPIIDTTSLSVFLNSRQLRNNQEFQSEVMSRIAAPMVGGMLSAVFLTLLVLPALFYLWRVNTLKSAVSIKIDN